MDNMITETIKNRRTIRTYSNKEIEDSLLNELFDLASKAPTTGNMQLYSVIVTKEEENKKLLAPAHFNQPMVTKAPVVLTICADFNRFSKWCEERDAVPCYNNFQSFIASLLDAMCFAQTFCDCAEAKGLGTCYLGTTTYNAGKIIEILSLPKLVVPVITITLGYPESIPSQADKLEIKAFVHNETYKDYTSDTINEIYRFKESLEENKKFIEENNKKTLAQVFTDIRYPEKNNVHFSKEFIEVLKQQGFMD